MKPIPEDLSNFLASIPVAYVEPAAIDMADESAFFANLLDDLRYDERAVEFLFAVRIGLHLGLDEATQEAVAVVFFWCLALGANNMRRSWQEVVRQRDHFLCSRCFGHDCLELSAYGSVSLVLRIGS